MMQAGNQEDIAKYSKRTVRVTQQHNDECKRLLTLMGVPVINVGVALNACTSFFPECYLQSQALAMV